MIMINIYQREIYKLY